MHYRLPHPGQGILGPAPAIYASQPTTRPSALSIMPMQDPTWHMNTDASSHLNFNASNLSTIFYKRLFSSVHVGDGKSIPVTNTGHSIIPSHHRPLHLHNVLVTPNIIKNLIYVRQFTRDNNCTIEFDAFGFSVKGYLTHHILLRCDSSSDLYPVTKPLTSHSAFLSTSTSTWHQHLGHPDVRGTVDFGLQLYASATTSLVGYTDADWAAQKKDPFLFTSAETEYRGVANVVAETAWLRNLLRELHSPLSTATLVYCDNVRVLHVPSRFQFANIFTKGLPSALFKEFRSSLSVRPPPAPTAGAY
ncbi:ribonuclease H-like domain-containing protein [Tanacetum coccineum]